MKRKLLSVLITVSMLVGMCACGEAKTETTVETKTDEKEEVTTTATEIEKEKETEDLVPMTLSFSTWVGSGPFYIAKEKGFYAEHGLDVDIKIVDDESTFASLMGSKSIDALGHVIDREVINYSKGIPETVVMAYDQSTGGDGIVVSEEIQTVEDLKGKTVALDKSSTSYFYFLTVISEAGLTEDDLEIKDMDADSAGTSFVQGQVDAAVTWEPWLTNAGEREGGHLLCDSADYLNTIVDVVSFTDAFIEEHPEEVKGFVAAWNEAVAWYNDGNQEEGDQIMADGLSIGLDDFKAQVSGVTWYDQSSMATFFDNSAENNIYEVGDRAIGFWVERSLIDSSFESSDLVSSDYIEK